MFSRFFSRRALGKSLLSATQSRPTTIAPSLFKPGTLYGTPDVRKIMSPLKRPVSVERTSPIAGQSVSSRRVIGDAVGLKYLRYLTVAVPRPNEIVRTETARDDHTNAMEFVSRDSASLTFDLLMMTPVLNGLVCVLVGTAKIWWDQLPAAERRKYVARATRGWRTTLRAVLAAGCGLFAAYLWSKTELDAATGRRRLFLYDDALLEREAVNETDMLVDRYRRCGMLVNPSAPVHQRVDGLVATLVLANSHVDVVRDRRWRVVVVDDPQTNAFITANGFIFVSTSQAHDANDDQLSFIIAHEMSHCVQRHINQSVSAQFAFNVAHLASTAVIWATWSSSWALLMQLFVLVVQTVLLELPLSRAMEFEADRDGLMLAARACVDVTESARYWYRRGLHADGPLDILTSWMSTHPSHLARARRLTALEPEARELQKSVGCETSPAVTAGRPPPPT